MEEFEKLAETVKAELKLNYDAKGVKFLEGFIERNKAQISKENWDGLINSCGAFLGQCIITNYGGQWVHEPDGSVVVAFDSQNKVYPFSKVYKQFHNGLEDSIYSMYSLIPTIFKLQPAKPWWKIW